MATQMNAYVSLSFSSIILETRNPTVALVLHCRSGQLAAQSGQARRSGARGFGSSRIISARSFSRAESRPSWIRRDHMWSIGLLLASRVNPAETSQALT